jgi:hypothetical protein
MFLLKLQSPNETSLKPLRSQNILKYSKGDNHGKDKKEKSFRQSQGSKRVPDRLYWLSLGHQESRESEKSFQK